MLLIFMLLDKSKQPEVIKVNVTKILINQAKYNIIKVI